MVFKLFKLYTRIDNWANGVRQLMTGTLRKVSHLSKCLVIVITMVLLTSYDVNSLSLGSVNCVRHVWSALLLSPPPYFVYICLSALTDI